MIKNHFRKQYIPPKHRLYLEGKYREGVPIKATAVIKQITKKGILLKNIRVYDCIEDHIWVLPKDGLDSYKIGEQILFMADVMRYYKSDGSYDFGLTHITKLYNNKK